MYNVESSKIDLRSVDQYQLEIDPVDCNKISCEDIEEYLIKKIFNIGQDIVVKKIEGQVREDGSGKYLVTVYNDFFFKDYR